ncbi:MAG: hypothetical protein IJJ77_05350 [Paludibacteraceae bacterium]|nr:hypothetical protein [Paludibacteraceae bacterium]
MKRGLFLMTTLTVLILNVFLTGCKKEEDLYGTWKLDAVYVTDNTIESSYIHFADNGYYYVFNQYKDGYWFITRYSYTYKAGYLKVKTIFNLGTNDYSCQIDDDEITIDWTEGTKTYKKCDKPKNLDEAIKQVNDDNK